MHTKRFTRQLTFTVTAAALGSGFQQGYQTAVLNVPQRAINVWIHEVSNDATDQGADLLWIWLSTIVTLGGVFGSLLTAFVAPAFGPKQGLLWNNILLFIAALILFWSKILCSIEGLIVGRFIAGVNCGLNSGLCIIYLSEIAPVSYRGAVLVAYPLTVTFAIAMAQILGMEPLLGNDHLWHYLFVVPMFFGLFQLVTLPFCVESPGYLINVKGDYKKAEEALKFLRAKEDVQDEMKILREEDERIKSSEKITYRAMFQVRDLRYPLIISTILMVARQSGGVGAVIVYSTHIFLQVDLPYKTAQYATISTAIVSILMTTICFFHVDQVGRKTLLQLSFGGLAIVQLMLAVTIHYSDRDPPIPYLIIFLIVMFIMVYSTGAGPIPWCMMSELFSQASRPKAIAVAMPCSWISTFIVTMLFPILRDLMHSSIFLVFCILNTCYFIFTYKWVPETKNQTIGEILSQL